MTPPDFVVSETIRPPRDRYRFAFPVPPEPDPVLDVADEDLDPPDLEAR